MHVFGPWQKDRVLRGNQYRYFRVSKLHTTSPLPGFEPEVFLTLHHYANLFQISWHPLSSVPWVHHI